MSFYLFEPDEGRYAEIPREMLQRGEWVVPYLQGEPYFDKPPLLYWLMAASFSVAGPTAAAARLWPALAGVGIAAVTGWIGIMLGGVAGFLLLRPWLPPESWKAVGALVATWIGGSANLVAVANALNLSSELQGVLIIVDMGEADRPAISSTWWWPGQRQGDPESLPEDNDIGAHHVIRQGERAYGGYFDKGVVVYAVRDRGSLELISSLAWPEGGHSHTHTALPLGERKLLVVTDEAIEPNCEGAPKNVHVVDVSDERHPREISRFPVPDGDYCVRGLRFGPHNLHENRPGTFQSDRIVYVTYFNAGLRVYDTSDPLQVREIACYVPEAPPGQPAIQFNDVLVTSDRLVFVTDRVRGGLYILQHV